MRCIRRLFPLLFLPALASAQAPHLTGRAVVAPAEGLLEADLCLSRFSERDEVRFLLSAAMNIRVVTDSVGRPLPYRGEYDGRLVGEAREYVVEVPDDARPLRRLCVSYRGAVPPFDRNDATFDWKGRVTSVGGVLRASEQSAWYPTLFDSTTGGAVRSMSYGLDIECPECAGIYLNGSRPVAGVAGRFASATPRGVLLLAGEVGFLETEGLSFVGGPAGPAAVRGFAQGVGEIAGYYEEVMGLPYRERPTFLTFRSVWSERPDGVPMWQFVTWPTIAMSGGVAFDSVLVDEGRGPTLPLSLWTTLSHEMAHYYFGTVLEPVGPLRWFAIESAAEYLSLKAVAALKGPAAGWARAIEVAQGMGTTTLPSLDRILEPGEITGTYRYNYAPAFLLALEARVGAAPVLAMLHNLARTPAGARIDFARLADAAEQGGLPRAALIERWDAGAIRGAIAAQAAMALPGSLERPETVGFGIRIASALLNVDTTVTGRLQVLGALRSLLTRDSQNLPALYQIGKAGALTGRETAVARAALETYLRFPAPSGAPSHAGAHWRLGQIAEHDGELDRARSAYRASLDLDPRYGPARDALARLGGSP